MQTILLGCPVHNRGWILPLYLKHVYEINYPRRYIALCFIVNDSYDDSMKLLREFKDEHALEYKDIILKELNFSMPMDIRQNRVEKKIYRRIADVRNAFLGCISDEDYVFSIDSDIMADENSMIRLLSHNKDIISALVFNDPDHHYPNILNVKNGKIEHYFNFPCNSLFQVDITGAAYLIKSEICKKVKYEYHILGEDVPFCLKAKTMGYELWCDSSVKCRHIMYPYMLNQ